MWRFQPVRYFVVCIYNVDVFFGINFISNSSALVDLDDLHIVLSH